MIIATTVVTAATTSKSTVPTIKITVVAVAAAAAATIITGMIKMSMLTTKLESIIAKQTPHAPTNVPKTMPIIPN
jgi:hypothetical protein